MSGHDVGRRSNRKMDSESHRNCGRLYFRHYHVRHSPDSIRRNIFIYFFVGSVAMFFARQGDVIDARDQAAQSIAKAKKELNDKQCKELSRFLRVISTAMKGMTLFPLGTAQGQQVWTEFLDSLFAEKDRLIKERNELMESSDGPNATTKDSDSKPMLRSGGMQQSDISLAKHDR